MDGLESRRCINAGRNKKEGHTALLDWWLQNLLLDYPRRRVEGSHAATGNASENTVGFVEVARREVQSCGRSRPHAVAETQSPQTVDLQLEGSRIKQQPNKIAGWSVGRDGAAAELADQIVTAKSTKARRGSYNDSPRRVRVGSVSQPTLDVARGIVEGDIAIAGPANIVMLGGILFRIGYCQRATADVGYIEGSES